MPSLRTEIVLAAPAEDIFDFLVRPENVIRVTAPGVGLKPVSAPEVFEQGSRIELELSGYGPPQRFLYEVIEFDRPNRFTETLVKGPLKSFRHEHLFEQTPQGTRVLDVVEFTPPGGMLGFLVTEERIRKGLEHGLRFRYEELSKIFGTP
jgi:ligand-binding SRPBCC domain-containing protein